MRDGNYEVAMTYVSFRMFWANSMLFYVYAYLQATIDAHVCACVGACVRMVCG